MWFRMEVALQSMRITKSMTIMSVYVAATMSMRRLAKSFWSKSHSGVDMRGLGLFGSVVDEDLKKDRLSFCFNCRGGFYNENFGEGVFIMKISAKGFL